MNRRPTSRYWGSFLSSSANGGDASFGAFHDVGLVERGSKGRTSEQGVGVGDEESVLGVGRDSLVNRAGEKSCERRSLVSQVCCASPPLLHSPALPALKNLPMKGVTPMSAIE